MTSTGPDWKRVEYQPCALSHSEDAERESRRTSARVFRGIVEVHTTVSKPDPLNEERQWSLIEIVRGSRCLEQRVMLITRRNSVAKMVAVSDSDAKR